MFKALFAAVTGGNPASWGILGLGAIILLGGTFGTGWYLGSTHEATIQADASVQAVQTALAAASKAQADKDAMDYAQGRSDGQRLQASRDAAELASARAKAPVVLLRAPAKTGTCPAPVVPAEALRRLNDPTLIGGAP